MRRTHIFRIFTLVLIFCYVHWATLAWAINGSNGGSLAIVSSVSGEATVTHGADRHSNAALFKGPVVYGDRIKTNKDGVVALLLSQTALLTLQELSDVKLSEGPEHQQILDVMSGKLCIAARNSGTEAATPILVRTPTARVTAQPGTLFDIQISQGGAPQPAHKGSDAVRVALKSNTTQVVESFTVIEGSIDIVSQAPGSATVTLTSGQGIRLVGGIAEAPRAVSGVKCQNQDLHLIPQHTATPKEAQDMIVEKETDQANALVAELLDPSLSAYGSQLSIGDWLSRFDLIIPTTEFTAPPSSEPPPVGPPNLSIANGEVGTQGGGITAVNTPAGVVITGASTSGLTATIPSPVISIVNTLNVSAGPEALLTVTGNSNLQTGSFLVLDPSSLTTSGSLLSVQAGSTVTATGPLLQLTGDSTAAQSSLTATGTPIVSVNGGTLTLNLGLVTLATSNITTTQAELLSITNAGTVSSAVPLVSLTNVGSIGSGNSLISVSGGGNLQASGSTLVSLNNASTLALTGSAPMVSIEGPGSVLTANTLISLQSSSFSGSPGGLLSITNGGRAELTALVPPDSPGFLSAGPFVTVTDGTLRTSGNFLQFAPFNTLSFGRGGVLTATNSTIDIGGSFAVFAGLNTTDFAVSINNSTLHVGGDLFNISGSGVTSNLAGLITTENAGNPTNPMTIGRSALGIDAGIVNATRPLFAFLNSNLQTRDFIRLSGTTTTSQFNPNLNPSTSPGPSIPGDALVNLNGSAQNVIGSFINVNGGQVNLTGNLVALNNSTLTVSGALVSVSAGGIFTQNNGSLAVFGTGTNILNITNDLCASSCNRSIPNLPVALLNGATTRNISINPTSTFPLYSGGVPTFGTTNSAALAVSGDNSFIRIGPQID